MMKLTVILTLASSALILNVEGIQKCISDSIFLPNENISVSNQSFSAIIQNKVIINDIWNKSEAILPYNVVPKLSNYEKGFIRTLSEKYLEIYRPFDFSQIPTISHECRRHAKKYITSLKNFELWALKLNDASARFSSGLLNGNINQLGDFDQCINLRLPDDAFKGKYCLAYLQPHVSTSLPYTNYLRRLLQSHEAFKSNLNDPGHRVPRFSTINFGVCVPSTCSRDDVENAIKHYTQSFTNGTGVQMEVRVESEMCYERDDDWINKLDFSTKCAIGLCILIIFATLASTLYEYVNLDNEMKNDLAVCFSLIKNTSALFSLERDSNDIKIAHSIRFFNAIMLLISHKCMAMFYVPYSNRTSMIEMLGRPWTVLARAASLYTDPFLMISGMLTAYSLFGKLQKSGRINILQEYLSRYLRIMPPLAFLILLCTFILPLTGSGPQWNLVVTHHAEICKENWWRNLLFIHNWFGFSNMCLTHTHHVGIDTELFWVAPFLIIALYKWPRRGLQLIIFLAVLSTVARYYITYMHNLSNYVSFGISVQQLFKTADLMYTLPPHRFTVYAMGILLGYVLRKFKDIKLTKAHLKIGWYVSTASLLLAFFGPAPMGDIKYKFNATHAAHYAAFAPIAWCIFFGWLILTTQLGHHNKFTDALEWRGFLISTRISYALYLVQFPVFFFNVGQVKTSVQYGFPYTIFNMNEFFSIFFLTIVFTLLIESPVNNLKDLIFKQRQKQAKSYDALQHLHELTLNEKILTKKQKDI